MKTVFNNDQVKHVWAQQRQESGRGNGSTSFEGPTLYSYGTPIANFITQKIKQGRKVSERKVCLITTEKYSVSTTRHMPHVSDIPGGIPVFNVKHIGVDRGRAPNMPSDWLKANLVHKAEEYAEELTKLARTRDQSNIDWRVNHLFVLKREAREYSEVMGIKFNIDKHFPEPDAEQLAKARDKAAKAAKKTAEATKARKLADQKQCADDVEGLLKGRITGLPYSFWRNATGKQKDTAREFLLVKWRAGDGVARWHDLTTETKVYLRLKPKVLGTPEGEEIPQDPDTIETSRGADFPIKHALRALPIIRRVVATGESWHTNGHTIHLGPFQIDAIEADGTVKAGCHTVTIDEIELIAKELGQ